MRLNESWQYDSRPATRHARNLAADPATVLRLEDGREAAVLKGESRPVVRLATSVDGSSPLCEASRPGLRPEPDAWTAPGCNASILSGAPLSAATEILRQHCDNLRHFTTVEGLNAPDAHGSA